jgi:hypothetical protein
MANLCPVQAHEIHFAPGQKGGLHFHPCPVMGYVFEGTAMLQVEGACRLGNHIRQLLHIFRGLKTH